VSTQITNQDFRKAMGEFATGICVMGAKLIDGTLIGITVNSFSSVSLEPPLILVCLGNYTPRTAAIIEAARFSISVLNEHQHAVSNHFAKPGEGEVPDDGWSIGKNGTPTIDDALANLECDLEATHLAGDHQIIIGRVTNVVIHPDRKPLIYFQSQYSSLGHEV